MRMQVSAAGAVGIGVIGAGRIGQVHARTLSSLPGANLIAVADPFNQQGQGWNLLLLQMHQKHLQSTMELRN